MKIAILSDLHFGITSNNLIVEQKTCQWLKEEFYPYIEKNNIDTIIFTGDLFNERKAINTKSGYEVIKYFINLLPTKTLLYVIPGNHDSLYNDNSSINSPHLLMLKYDNIKVIDKPTHISSINADLFPWGTSPEELNTGKYAFGHFDIVGMMMNNGVVCKKGLDKSVFNKYHLVFSGHYHMPTHIDNIIYVGNPIQQKWSEVDFDHRFIVLNTDSGKYISIKTEDEKYKIFEKIFFNDNKPDREFNPENKVVKIFTNDSVENNELHKYRDSLYNNGAISIKIISSCIKDLGENDFVDYENVPSIIMIKNYITDSVELMEIDKNLLSSFCEKYYNEAINANT